MRWHRIDEQAVAAAIEAPDREEMSVAGRVNRWRRADDRSLRVTCREEPERIIVISAVFKRRTPSGSLAP